MLLIQPEKPNQPSPDDETVIVQVIRKTSAKIKAIGAGLQVFLQAVEKITFSKDPVHIPDQKLIDEAVRLLTEGPCSEKKVAEK